MRNSYSENRRDPFAPPRKVTTRKRDFESLLCTAIANRNMVTLHYKKEGVARTFQPSAVFHSTTGKVLVSGVQITNPAKPEDDLEAHDFEVGLIDRLSATETVWITGDTLDRSAKKYAKGIICP